MNRHRNVGPVMMVPTHGGRIISAMTTDECAIHTVELPEGHFAAIVISRKGEDVGALAILDRDEVDAHVTALQNAMEDAERLDAGLPMIHAAPSGTHQ